jgi:hypothetical protein
VLEDLPHDVSGAIDTERTGVGGSHEHGSTGAARTQNVISQDVGVHDDGRDARPVQSTGPRARECAPVWSVYRSLLVLLVNDSEELSDSGTDRMVRRGPHRDDLRTSARREVLDEETLVVLVHVATP